MIYRKNCENKKREQQMSHLNQYRKVFQMKDNYKKSPENIVETSKDCHNNHISNTKQYY
jgi:hypothetical protein